MNTENNSSNLLNSSSQVDPGVATSSTSSDFKGRKVEAEPTSATSYVSIFKKMFSVNTSYIASKSIDFLTGDYSTFFQKNIENAKAKFKKHLNEDLQTQIEKFIPQISENLFESLKSSVSYEVIQEVCLRQKVLIMKVLETNLYKLVANVVEKTSLNLNKTQINLSDVLIEFNKIVGDECKNALYDLINNDISEEHFDEPVAPFKQNFLAYLFPNGTEDILLPQGNIIQFVKGFIFNKVGDYLPNIFKSLFKETKLNVKYIKDHVQKDLTVEEFEDISRKSGFIAGVILEKALSSKIQITSDEQAQCLVNKELDVLKNHESFTLSTVPYVKESLKRIVTRIIGLHVVKYNKLHRDDASTDVMTKFSIQIIDLLDKCISKLDENFFDKLQNLRDPANREFVLTKIEPLIVKILKKSGFENAETLPIPESFKKSVWQKITKDILPNLIVDQLEKVMLLKVKEKEEVVLLKDGDQFASFIKICSKKALPLIQKHLTSNAEKYATDISEKMEMPQILDKTSVKNIINAISSAKEQSVKNILSYFPDIFYQFVTPLLLNFASKETQESKRTLKNITSHLLHLIQNTQDDIQISMDQYELFNLVQSVNLDDVDLKNPAHVDLMKYYYGKTFFHDENALDEKTKNILYEIYFGKAMDTFFYDMGIDKELFSKGIREYFLKISCKLYTLLNDPLDQKKEYQKSLYKLFGINDESLKDRVKDLSDQSKDYPIIESAINLSAELIQKEIKTYLKNKAANITANFLDLDKEMEDWFGESIKSIVKSKVSDDVWSYSLDVLKATVTKIFIDVAEKSQESDKTIDPKKILPNFLEKIAKLFRKEIKKINAEYKNIMQLKDGEERTQALRALFTPLSSKVLNFAGSNLLETLPIPESLKITLLDNINQKVLPDIFASLYDDIALWHNSSDADELNLMHLFIKDKPKIFKDTAGIIARFTSDFLPAYLQNPQNRMAIVLRDKIIDFMLKQSGSDAEKLRQYLSSNKDEVKRLVREHLDALVKNDSLFLKETTAGFERYIEVAVLKMMSNLFENVNKLQKKKQFYIDLGLKLLGICNQHFGKLVDIMKSNKRDVAYDIDESVLKRDYDLFHKALDPDATAHLDYKKSFSPEEIKKNKKKKVALQQKNEREKFYIPFAKKVLKLANVTRNSLPVPESVKDQFFEMLQNQLGPLLLENIMDSIDVDKILLSMLKSLNEESATVSNKKVHVMQEDPTQAEINNACGDLFLNLIRLIPSPGVQSLFEKALKNTTSEALGFLFRTQLTDVNFTHVISDSLSKLMLNLNDQITMDDQGNLNVPDDLKFDFPKTISQSKAKVKADLEAKKKTQALLVKELSKTVGIQITTRVSNFFAEPWRKFQEKLDAWLKKVFGSKAVDFKEKIHKYLENVFINIMLALLYVITIPVRLIVKRILLKKAKDVTTTLHMDIHKNLVFNLVDATLKYLEDVGDSLEDDDGSSDEMPDEGILNLSSEIQKNINFN